MIEILFKKNLYNNDDNSYLIWYSEIIYLIDLIYMHL